MNSKADQSKNHDSGLTANNLFPRMSPPIERELYSTSAAPSDSAGVNPSRRRCFYNSEGRYVCERPH